MEDSYLPYTRCSKINPTIDHDSTGCENEYTIGQYQATIPGQVDICQVTHKWIEYEQYSLESEKKVSIIYRYRKKQIFFLNEVAKFHHQTTDNH